MSTVHLSNTKFIKQHEIESGTRENDAIRRDGKHELYEASAGVTQYTILRQTYFYS